MIQPDDIHIYCKFFNVPNITIQTNNILSSILIYFHLNRIQSPIEMVFTTKCLLPQCEWPNKNQILIKTVFLVHLKLSQASQIGLLGSSNRIDSVWVWYVSFELPQLSLAKTIVVELIKTLFSIKLFLKFSV